ncbi:ABC transporter permease subunit [Paralysiella testudinis]|uniref:ABC transporter ATP-binding protein n=1 Tax=Paralysiella testudinis TaxID=2809020 RepID=A0A892ZHH9_9NEIS|nr:ABC transporter ATP-binding protein [Paralysiella testudinis]QRQ82621.1 ABC transporter ATP-binding protein [Paralysiella testudinis]
MFFLNKLNPKQSLLGIIVCIALLAVLPFVAKELGGTTWVRIIDMALLYIMLALGLNIVVGFAGLLDLGYIAFYAVGAYAAALLASGHLTDNFAFFQQHFPDGLHFSYWMIIPLGAMLAAIAGIMLGTPILKLRGDYLALVTLGFGEIIRIFMNNWGKDGFNLTNGPRGINRIDSVSVFGHPLDRAISIGNIHLTKEFLYYYLFLALVTISIFVCYRLQASRLGRAWMALREDDIAAKAMGINVRNVKLLAFSLGATFGGVAGAMFAAFQGFISPESFSFMESIVILTMVVLGGMGHIPGVILGAVLLSLLPEFLRFTVEPLQQALFGTLLIDTAILRQLILGLCMVLIMLFRPRGLWPRPERSRKKDDDINNKPVATTTVV